MIKPKTLKIYLMCDYFNNIKFSLLRGINKISLQIYSYNKEKYINQETESFECKDLEIFVPYKYYIEETLKRIRPTHILRICS